MTSPIRACAALSIILTVCAAPGPSRAGEAPAVNLRRTIIVDVAEKTKDAVVYISSKRMATKFVSAFPNDPFWREFGQMQNTLGTSLGSGFIVHADGYIVTNNHVVDRARQISVELLDGRKFEAELVSADAQADIAILKINAEKPLPALELGDSSDLMIGEPVIAVGNPLGFLTHTVSTGIVSAIHRDLQPSNGVQLQDLIQTDAAINPGNSGGPLLNAYGQVIGINTAIVNAQNIGFAIQVSRLRDLIPALMDPAQAKKLEMNLKLKEDRKLTPPATVAATVKRSDGATLVSIAGDKPRDVIDAYAMLLKQKENQLFEVVFEGQPPLKITPRRTPLPDALVKAKQRLGITVEPVTPMLAERLGLRTEEGVHVVEVARGSVADAVKMQPGDVILQLGMYRISKFEDFAMLVGHLPPNGPVAVVVMRGDALMSCMMKL